MATQGEMKFDLGDRVFAKVRGYPTWPARIESPAQGTGKNAKYAVFFYGTYDHSVCKVDAIFPYNQDTLKKYRNIKRKGFAEGLEEIRTNPTITTQEVIDARNKKSKSVKQVANAANRTPDGRKNGDRGGKNGSTSRKKTLDSTSTRRGRKKKVSSEAKMTLLRSVALATETSPTLSCILKPKKLEFDDGNSTLEPSKRVPVEAHHPVEISLDQDRLLGSPPPPEQGNVSDEIWMANVSAYHETGNCKGFCSCPEKTSLRENKIKRLETESKLLDLNLIIVRSAHFERPDMEKCLHALEDINNLDLTPLIFKNQPDVVETIEKMKVYVGPEESDNAEMKVMWEKQSHKIRMKASQILKIWHEE